MQTIPKWPPKSPKLSTVAFPHITCELAQDKSVSRQEGYASQVESRLHQGECPPDPSCRSALTTPPFADGDDPGGLQARSPGGDSSSRCRCLQQVLGTVRGARAPLGCWPRRSPSACALICAHRLQMLDDKFQLLYFELAEGSGLKFIRAEASTAAS